MRYALQIFLYAVVIGLFLSMLPRVVLAQEARMWTYSTQRGIAICWDLPNSGLLPQQWEILRRESGSSTYQRIGLRGILPASEWLKIPQMKTVSEGARDTLQRMIQLAMDSSQPDSIRREVRELLEEALLMEYPSLDEIFGVCWLDTSVQKGKEYDYAIRAADRIVAEKKNVEWRGEVLLPPPTEVIVEPEDSNHLALRWDITTVQRDGIWGFIVERLNRERGQWEVVTSEPLRALFLDPSLPVKYLYLDTGLVVGERYRYRVRAVDLLGRMSEASEEAEGIVMDIRPLIPPIAFTAWVEGGRVILRWKKSPDPRVVGYFVYRWEYGKEDQKERITDSLLTDTVFVDRPQTQSEYITYAATAVDLYGRESELSFSHTVPQPDTISPEPPQVVQAESRVGKITLRWRASPSPDLYAYEVARTIDPIRGEFTLVSDSLLQDTIFQDELPAEAGRTTFWYRVRAVDRAGNRSQWSVPVAIRLPDVVPPHPPWIKKIEAEDGALRIHWIPPYDPDLYGYFLFRYEDTTETPVQLNVEPLPKGQNVFRDTTVSSLKSYWYRIVAVDSAGNLSQPSFPVIGRTYTIRTPATPQLDSVIVLHDGIRIVFSLSDSPSAFDGVVIERSLDGKHFVPITGLLPVTTRWYIDRTAHRYKTVYYRIRVRSRTGVWSPPSEVAEVVLPEKTK